MPEHMKRLIPLPLDPEQHEEIVRLLQEAQIEYREISAPSRLLSSDAMWVAEDDYPRAHELVQKQSKAFAARRRDQWQAEWTSEHAQSYARWLYSRLRMRPAETLLKLAALLALIGLLLIYPLTFLF